MGVVPGWGKKRTPNVKRDKLYLTRGSYTAKKGEQEPRHGRSLARNGAPRRASACRRAGLQTSTARLQTPLRTLKSNVCITNLPRTWARGGTPLQRRTQYRHGSGWRIRGSSPAGSWCFFSGYPYPNDSALLLRRRLLAISNVGCFRRGSAWRLLSYFRGA